VTKKIEIVEVGARDGLQNEAMILDVDAKLEFIRRLEAAGARRLEAVSFVNPRRVPQMAGAEEIMAALPPKPPGGSRIGLVLNLKGWDRCVAAGCDEANVVVCASDGFGIRNQGAATSEQIKTMTAIAERSKIEGPPVSVTISVAFGCPFDGEVAEERVVQIARSAAEAGVEEIALADTIGVADPWTVRKRIEAVKSAAPTAKLRLHFHDTRRTGLANAFAGVEAGVSILDASCGGIGGCPFAPNATGNIATEDLVYMLNRAGFETGLDLDRLVQTAEWIAGKLGKDATSALSRAGGFPLREAL
jgi:hydroxymethylglutaryl-CoA lyase